MKRRSLGFTLIEVLIALAIIAIGLTAALRASGAGTDGTLEYRNRLLALWLAQNVVAERTARVESPPTGVQEHETDFAGQRFLLREEIKSTPNLRFLRLEVTVASPDQPDRALRHLVAFLVRTD